MRKNAPYFILIGILALADQATKQLILKALRLGEIVPVIPGFFNITHVHNRGAIFGFFSHSEKFGIFALLTLAQMTALGLVAVYFFRTPPSEKMMKLGLSLILAGAMGNLADRLFRGYVVDFLELYVKTWSWPSFNLADSCITIGAFCLFFCLFRRKPACSPSSSS
jgi:signal peptidase II